MKNPNAPISKLKAFLKERWSGVDHPGSSKRFQIKFFGKDLLIFIFLPLCVTLMFNSCSSFGTQDKTDKKAKREKKRLENYNSSTSQIINFESSKGIKTKYAGISKRSPGTLVKLRLLNNIEAYSSVPIHARIVNSILGKNLVGGTIIGSASADPALERIHVTFNYVRHPSNKSMGIPIVARALSLDGSFGIVAHKKEGFFARSALGSATASIEGLNTKSNGSGLKEVLFKALSAGLIQEMGTANQVEKTRAHILTLKPGQEFYAELTDFFPQE